MGANAVGAEGNAGAVGKASAAAAEAHEQLVETAHGGAATAGATWTAMAAGREAQWLAGVVWHGEEA